MKYTNLFAFSALITMPFALVSCETFEQIKQPLSGSSEYNPLDAPGASASRAAAEAQNSEPQGPTYTPGTFLQTVSSSTSFFSKFPKGNDQPTKILSNATDVKVISMKGSYAKVEVIDTGDVGYVPTVMLGEKRSPNEVPVTSVSSVSSESSSPELPSAPPEISPEVASDIAPAILPEAVDSTNSATPDVAPEPEVQGLTAPELVDPSKPAE